MLPAACLEMKDGVRERKKVGLYAPLQGQELPLSAINATAALLQPKGPVGLANGIPLETKEGLSVLTQCKQPSLHIKSSLCFIWTGLAFLKTLK